MRLPENYKEIDLEMSNFDHTIDNGLEARLRNDEVFGRHAAWDFNGMVWFHDEKFHEEVWTYQSYNETISADTLQDLMTDVNDKYGYE